MKKLDFVFVEGVVYELKNVTSACVNDEKYVVSAVTGNYFVGDCYPCDEHGNVIYDDYTSPVPFEADNLKEAVGIVNENY